MDLRDKVVFWDIDGTLASYDFFGSSLGFYEEGTELGRKVEEGFFRDRQPSVRMQRVVKEVGARRNFILSHTQSQRERLDKKIWVKENFPMMDDIFVIPLSQSKDEILEAYCNRAHCDRKDVVLIDDNVKILEEVEKHGFGALHVSCFYDYGMK